MVRPFLIGVIHKTWKSRSVFTKREGRGIQGAKNACINSTVSAKKKEDLHTQTQTEIYNLLWYMHVKIFARSV